jgi:preprotein translocase subunit SecY
VIYGVARQADEGAAAHPWQVLMAGQIPVIAFFAIKWLPRTPGQALAVLALQAGAGLAAAAPIFLLNW